MAPGQDEHARFTRLVLRHFGEAYSLPRWITRNRADAEDVVHVVGHFPGGARGFVGLALVRPSGGRLFIRFVGPGLSRCVLDPDGLNRQSRQAAFRACEKLDQNADRVAWPRPRAPS